MGTNVVYFQKNGNEAYIDHKLGDDSFTFKTTMWEEASPRRARLGLSKVQGPGRAAFMMPPTKTWVSSVSSAH